VHGSRLRFGRKEGGGTNRQTVELSYTVGAGLYQNMNPNQGDLGFAVG
jgi:hypothetical protein